MQHHLTLATRRVLRIAIIIVIACAIGLLAGHNNTGASAVPQQPVAAPHLGKAP
jgi:hypothetical protein